MILADEPTGDLDRRAADDILDLGEKLRSQLGKTILMVTHDPIAAEPRRRSRRIDRGVWHPEARKGAEWPAAAGARICRLVLGAGRAFCP